MKKLFILAVLCMCASIAYGYEPSSDYLGDSPEPQSVTISSYTTTPIISTQAVTLAGKVGFYTIVNNGNYSVYVTTYLATVPTTVASAANAFQVVSGGYLNIQGRVLKGLYALIGTANSNTSRLDIFLIKEE